jgi:hypothetical protein
MARAAWPYRACSSKENRPEGGSRATEWRLVQARHCEPAPFVDCLLQFLGIDTRARVHSALLEQKHEIEHCSTLPVVPPRRSARRSANMQEHIRTGAHFENAKKEPALGGLLARHVTSDYDFPGVNEMSSSTACCVRITPARSLEPPFSTYCASLASRTTPRTAGAYQTA